MSAEGPSKLQQLLTRAWEIDYQSADGLRQLDALQAEIVRFKQQQLGNKYVLDVKDSNGTKLRKFCTYPTYHY